MGREDEVGPVLVLMQRNRLEVRRVEALWIHDRAGHMPEDQELLGGEAQVVAIGGAAKAQDRLLAVLRIEMTDQLRLKGLEHALGGLLVNPTVVLEH